MKKIGITLLIIAALSLEVNFLKIWYLPYMDYDNIAFIYTVSLVCRIILYSTIVAWYDMMWMKYITNNTVAYKNGLIQLYRDQLTKAGPYMTQILQKATRELKAGKNPTKVEDWVVKMEKEYRSRI